MRALVKVFNWVLEPRLALNSRKLATDLLPVQPDVNVREPGERRKLDAQGDLIDGRSLVVRKVSRPRHRNES